MNTKFLKVPENFTGTTSAPILEAQPSLGIAKNESNPNLGLYYPPSPSQVQAKLENSLNKADPPKYNIHQISPNKVAQNPSIGNINSQYYQPNQNISKNIPYTSQFDNFARQAQPINPSQITYSKPPIVATNSSISQSIN